MNHQKQDYRQWRGKRRGAKVEEVGEAGETDRLRRILFAWVFQKVQDWKKDNLLMPEFLV